MLQRKFLQHLFASGSKRQQHFAPVEGAPMAPDEACIGEAIHQFHRAMMLDLQALSNFGNSRTPAGWQSFQRQHELVLPGFQSNPACILLTKMQKAANLMP